MTPSPSRLGGGYGYGYPGANGTGSSGSGSGTANGHLGVENRGFRPATPNKRSVVALFLRRIERATRDKHIEQRSAGSLSWGGTRQECQLFADGLLTRRRDTQGPVQ